MFQIKRSGHGLENCIRRQHVFGFLIFSGLSVYLWQSSH